MDIKKQIDEMNKEAISLAPKDFQASITLSNKALKLAQKEEYILGESTANHNLGVAHYYNRQNDEAYEYYRQALELLKSSENYERQAATLHNLALIDYDRCDFSAAVNKHKKALELRKRTGNYILIALSLDYIGIGYQAMNDFENALRFHLDSYRVKQNQEETVPENIIRSLFNIGQVYSEQHKYEKAKEYFSEALKICRENDVSHWLPHIGQSLGTCDSYLGNYNEAEKILKESVILAKEQNDLRSQSAAFNGLGVCFGFTKNFKDALKCYKKSLAITQKLGLSREIAVSLRNIGMMQTELDLYQEAEKSIEEGLKFAIEINEQLIISSFYKAESNLFAAQDNFKKAYENQLKYSEFIERISSEKEENTIARLKVEFDLERKEREAEIHKLKNVTLVEANKKLVRSEESLKKLTENLEQRVKDELKKREEQQQQLIQKSKLESIGKLAAGIAHEINQPLGGISMGLENIYFAHSEGRLTGKYLEEKLEHIDGYFERINQIIDHIRIFSRDQKEILFEDVDVNQTINDALSLLKTQYENHNVALNIELADRIPIISGNKFKLEQVVLNLLTNAKDAVDEKEENTDSSYQKKITIRSYSENRRVYLEIEDNGNGIQQENLKKIFDPFFTTKDPAKGTGLGLSIIYGIIKEMNGEISVESEVGEFTRMKIKFES